MIQPPRVAVWLVDSFAPAERAESILGDLLEAYRDIATQSSAAYARLWYWRQTRGTIAHLARAAFRDAPWSIAAAVAAGFLLLRFGFRLEERAMFAVLASYAVYEHHFKAYLFFSSNGLDVGRVVLAIFVGYMVGLAAKGREMVAAMTLACILLVMAGAASLAWLPGGQGPLLWTLPWHCAGSIAIVFGAAIVRTRRRFLPI